MTPLYFKMQCRRAQYWTEQSHQHVPSASCQSAARGENQWPTVSVCLCMWRYPSPCCLTTTGASITQMLWRVCHTMTMQPENRRGSLGKQQFPSGLVDREAAAPHSRFHLVVFLTTSESVMLQQMFCFESWRPLQLTSSTTSIRPREETKGREVECSTGERCTYLSMSAILAESQVMLKREKRREGN